MAEPDVSEAATEPKRDSGASSSTQPASIAQSVATDDFNAAAIFGRGLVSCIVPMVSAIDSSVDGVRTAQVELSKQLQSLSEILRRTQDAEARGPELDAYARRISNCRRRLMITGTLLNNIQTRMARLQSSGRKLAEQHNRVTSTTSAPSTVNSSPSSTGTVTVS